MQCIYCLTETEASKFRHLKSYNVLLFCELRLINHNKILAEYCKQSEVPYRLEPQRRYTGTLAI
jgi:hypothetical protein